MPETWTDDEGAVWVRRGSVEAALEASITAAKELKPDGIDAAGIAALRVLAGQIDRIHGRAAGVTVDGQLLEELRGRPMDNVTLPTFLRYLEAYGLTVSSRAAAAAGAPVKKPPKKGLAAVQQMVPRAS